MKTPLLESFNNTTNQLIELLSSVNEKQLNQIPYKNSWTAGQVGDHLLKSYGITEVLNGNTENTDREPDKKLSEIQKIFLDYTIKMESPPEILPSKEFIQKKLLLSSLKERIGQHINIILTKDLSKICLDFNIPEYGPFTRMEWIGFSTIHTQRHIHQLKNIIVSI